MTPSANHDGHSVPTNAERRKELGISEKQDRQWQALAAVSEEQFEAAIAAPDKPTTSGIIAANAKPKQKSMDPIALWVCGRISDFERNGVLDADPQAMFAEMLPHMQQTVERLGPRVIDWIRRLVESAHPPQRGPAPPIAQNEGTATTPRGGGAAMTQRGYYSCSCPGACQWTCDWRQEAGETRCPQCRALTSPDRTEPIETATKENHMTDDDTRFLVAAALAMKHRQGISDDDVTYTIEDIRAFIAGLSCRQLRLLRRIAKENIVEQGTVPIQ